ncbi:hypothetical protein [Streptomyces sp.]|uniref:hypothetical protein n=1 Tax=Streptomyces sp. TaxID=1931 RepID=UPI002D787A85|nr:hypothetical protein [Streptomyces sp.]HET6353622.1 hypothetical protein [Streptomyces sp.]
MPRYWAMVTSVRAAANAIRHGGTADRAVTTASAATAPEFGIEREQEAGAAAAAANAI